MADYNPILATETDPDAPLRSSLFKRLVANPIAIAEGATNAPRVLGKALGSTFRAYQSVSATTPAQWLGLDAMETIRVDLAVSTWGSAAVLQVRFSNDNGSTWGSYQTLVSNAPGVSTFAIGCAHINLRTGAVAAIMGTNPVSANSATLTVPTGCNAFQIRHSTGASAELRAMAWCLGGLEA